MAMRQDIHSLPTAVQFYALGARHQLDDRVFRYARAGGVLTPDFPAKNADFQHVTWAVVAAALAGAQSVVVTVSETELSQRMSWPAAMQYCFRQPLTEHRTARYFPIPPLSPRVAP